MNRMPKTIDYWRTFFSATREPQIQVLKAAIRVALADHPEEAKKHRNEITAMLYGCRNPCCQGSGVDAMEEGNVGTGSGMIDIKGKAVINDDPVHGTLPEEEEDVLVVDESLTVEENVNNIKVILGNQDEENILINALRSLERMDITLEVLRATNIGRVLNGFRKHNSEQISSLATALYKNLKKLVPEMSEENTASEEKEDDKGKRPAKSPIEEKQIKSQALKLGDSENEEKLEGARKRLSENDKEAEKGKKKKNVQVLEPEDIPKPQSRRKQEKP